jgi:Flp pilus assembly protein TadD
VKINQVAEDLGVRYVLEGSVRRAGNTVRVNAQLIDALTGGHVWADRYDSDVTDIFAAQDKFLGNIVEALKVNLTKPEKEEITRAKPDNFAAKEAFDEGWNLYLRFNAQDSKAAVEPLERAIQLDPSYGRAFAALALVYCRAWEYGWLDAMKIDVSQFNRKIYPLLQNAKKYPTALAHVIEANDHLYEGNADAALRDAEQAISLEPNDPEAHIVMAWALTISGKPKDGMNFIAAATRLNPNYPSHYVLARGIALFAADDLEQAATVLAEGAKQNPSADTLLPPLASVLAQLGRRDEARKTLLSWRPNASQFALERMAAHYSIPYNWARDYMHIRQRLLDGMRLAALPLDINVSSLRAELRQADPMRREGAAAKLGWFGPAAVDAVPDLVSLIDDSIARKEAVLALGKIGPPAKAAIPDLERLQNESIIGSYAKDALKKIRSY